MSQPDAVGAQPLARNREFNLLWLGGMVSAVGSRASSIALPLLVLGLGGSATDAGLVGFAALVPFLLFQLAAGAAVDRWNRRVVMLVTDAGRLVAVGSVAVALLLGRPALAQLVAVAFVEGTLTVFHDLAERAAIRHVVSDGQLTAAMSRNEASVRGAYLAGQPLGGALYAIARWVPFLADALSYVVSLLTVLALRGRFRAVPADEPQGSGASPGSQVWQGVAWLWRQPFLRVAVVAIAASNLLFQALGLVVIVVVTRSGVSSTVLGFVFAAAGAGGLLGAVAAPWCARRVSLKHVLIGANWAWAGLVPLLIVARGPATIAAVFALIAFVGPLWNVAVSAFQMRITPDHLQGRVGSAIGTVSFGAAPLGALLAGVLLDHGGPTAALTVLATFMAVVAALVHLAPAVRRAPALDTAPTTPDPQVRREPASPVH